MLSYIVYYISKSYLSGNKLNYLFHLSIAGKKTGKYDTTT